MSFYVVDRKPPASCEMCDMMELSGAISCPHAYDTTNSSWGRRLCCPIIETPSHGRLVDLDFILSMDPGYFDCDPYEVPGMKETLEKMPVIIIPAEGN